MKKIYKILILLGLLGLIFLAKARLGPSKTIVIDAGHGGKDPGTIGAGGSYEKDINLRLARTLSKKLRFRGYRVIMTRTMDEYVDNELRARLANEAGADLVLSLHCNALENNTTTRGLQVLYYPSGNNQELAGTMMEALLDRTGAQSRGLVAREGLILLNQTRMPSLIIEAGFLTNREEEVLLASRDYQSLLADGIVQGLENIFAN